MLLVIDAGNTNTMLALCEADNILHRWRFKTDSGRTADEYAALLAPLMSLEQVAFNEVSGVLVSSVVPDANFHLARFAADYCTQTAHFLTSRDLSPFIEILLDKPEEIGADRLVNALAVKHHYQTPAIVIDFGTATTFDVLDDQGRYAGGVIAPGIHLSLNALHMAASKLPKVCIQKPPHVTGKNTVHAMQSGLYWGYVSLMAGVCERLSAELSAAPYVIATGGLASVFADDLPFLHQIDEDLTLKGLLCAQTLLHS